MLRNSKRQSFYRDPKIANFLLNLLKTGEEIKAQIDAVYGYRYPQVESAMDMKPNEAKDFLKKLVEAEILFEEFSEMLICCPSCGGANISTSYICPFCGSPRIMRDALIEHMVCGFIGKMSAFRSNDELICPKCKATLSKNGYRSVGKWYECMDCGRRIEVPQVIHTCRNCGEKFTFDDAKYVEVYKYSLSDIAKTEIRSGAIFSAIARDFFKNSKNKNIEEITIPAVLKGESGANHSFDVLIKLKKSRRGKYVAVDYLFSTDPIDQTDIAGEYAKALDTKVNLYIVAPKITDEAKNLAKKLGLTVIIEELPESLNALNKHLKAFLH